MRGLALAFVLLASSAQVARAQAYPVWQHTGTAGTISCHWLRCSPTGDAMGLYIGEPGCLDLGGFCDGSSTPGVTFCTIPDTPTCCETSGMCVHPSGDTGRCETGLRLGAGDAPGVCAYDFCGAGSRMQAIACLKPPAGSAMDGVYTLATGDCDGDLLVNSADSCPCESADTRDGCPDVVYVDAGEGTPNVPIDLRGRGGCECRAGGSPSGSAWWLLGLGLLWLTRRRR